MELAKPPPELRTIIDKLAQFVARNGPEFEQMTKNKQKGNPKFGFLFGGDHFNYYQYKVTTEQAILKQKESRDAHNNSMMVCQNQPPQPWIQPPPGIQPPISLESIVQQQQVLQEQTSQSEQNLNAQHMVLMQSQQNQIEEAIRKYEFESIMKDAEELGISLKEFDLILQPIIDSCTKDSISNGKAWILQKATGTKIHDFFAKYLLYKVLEVDRHFTHKLHIIYLVNDILHNCVRKHMEDLKIAFEKVVVPMFCSASINVSEDQQAKLNKLLTIWESKNHYFADDIVSQLRDPDHSFARYKQQRLVDRTDIVEAITQSTKAALTNFQSQHFAFISHAHRQIQNLEQQKQQLLEHQKQQLIEQQKQLEKKKQEALNNSKNEFMDEFPAITEPPPIVERDLSQPPPTNNPPPVFDLPININQPPPGFLFPPRDVELPDLTRPPPGFPPVLPEVLPEDLLPSLPYYDLPAGLMVPLIKLDDFNYKSLDPESIRLPPPAPPSERLLAAVKAFYTPPGHDQPRDKTICRGENVDSDGWEKLGLYEYFRAKAAAKKQREMDIESGIRSKSRSPTPVKSFNDSLKSPPPKRRYSSRSRSRSKERDRKSRRGRRDRSRSPRDTRSERSDENTNPSRENRSPTPPSFLGVGSFTAPVLEDRLSEANKGHQMLRKMGWAGAGLGVKEQGIEQPIAGGDVRDRTDKYKGVGVNLNDPYENFRKSKGKAFITRMKARAEERSAK